jgi:3-methyladenine DNA glycosylase AlkD
VTTLGDPLDPMAVAAEIDREIRALPAQGVEPVRAVRRAWSRRLRPASAEVVERLGEGMADWGSVDAFGCTVSGPVWRRGGLPDEAVHRWAAPPDRWWRRAALVSTVPLNLRSRGGTGDTERTLDICRRLAADGDDMVVKALSWALRELVVWDPEAVRRFLDDHDEVLAAWVRREVRSKLETGRKHPARRVT